MNLDLLVWLIPVPPLLSFFIILLFTRRSKIVSDIVAVSAILVTWVLAIIVFVSVLGIEHLGEHPIWSRTVWLPLGAGDETSFFMGTLVDPLTAVLLFFVPLTASMIFIYSTGYMASGHYWTAIEGEGDHHDEHDHEAEANHGQHLVEDSAGRKLTHFDATTYKARFMAFISLFAAGMLFLTVADNLLLLFMGWEIMGLCSYLLIGFWHNRVYPNQPDRMTPRVAAIKAFMTTRVADVLMLLGIAWLYSYTGTLSFRAIFNDPEMLHLLESAAFPNSGISLLAGLTVAEAIGLLLFTGTIGKSAQFPLHVWLPDAMEGPTPVSAMIHAATMVSAGVYMIIRMYPLLSLGAGEHGATAPMAAMAFIGAFTALFAATIALAQKDVKAVLAYSTISQLGYMVAALGIGAYVAAAFHLMTHAIFKALLFMGSGSIIHAVEHGEEHAEHHGHHFPIDFDAQNMFNMGGLWNRIPVTAWTFLIGGFALSGFPIITAGFWSKDEILADAWYHEHFVVFVVLALAAFLTAFYTMRQIGLTFAGAPRTHAADEATQSDWRMNLPLVILAFFSITVGWVGIPEWFPRVGELLGNPFHEFVAGTLVDHPESVPFNGVPIITSVVVALGGLLIGYLVYVVRPLEEGQVDPLAKLLGPIYPLLENAYYFDELYDRLFIRPAQWLAWQIYAVIDRQIIDGFLHFVGRSTEWWAFRNKDFDTYIVNKGADDLSEGIFDLGQAFKYLQSGRVQQYLTVAAAGLLTLAGVFLVVFVLR